MVNVIPSRAIMPVRRITEQAARIFGIPVEVLVGPRRLPAIAQARFAIYNAAFHAGWSSPHIARILAGRDHSTILYGRDRAADIAQRDADYAARLAQLKAFADGPAYAPYLGEAPAPVELRAKREKIVGRMLRPVAPRENIENDELERRSRRAGSIALLTALRREHPERFAA